MSKKLGFMGNLPNKNKRIKAIAKLALALTIFLMYSVVKMDIAYGAEVGVDVEETVYKVDDIRDLIWSSRECGEVARADILFRARSLKLSKEQLEIIEKNIGTVDREEFEQARFLRDIADSKVNEFENSMKSGKNIKIVQSLLEEAQVSIETYRCKTGFEYEGTYSEDMSIKDSVVTEDETIDRYMESVEEFIDCSEANVKVGTALGLEMNKPFENCEVTKSIEDYEGQDVAGTVLRSTGTEAQDLMSLFDCVVVTVSENSIVLGTGKRLTVVYNGQFECSAKEGDAVEQGQVIGDITPDTSLEVLVLLDNSYVDMLRLLGSDGMILKNEYIRKSDKDIAYDNLEDAKNSPSEDVADEEMRDVIEVVFVE